MRNQLEGRPRFHVQLNDTIRMREGNPQDLTPGTLVLDDMNFHPSVDVAAFETEKCLHLTGPEGFFTAMNYRSTYRYAAPILVHPMVEQVSEYKLDIVLKVTTNFSDQLKCNELLVSFHSPITTSSCKCELPADVKKQSTDYSEQKHLVMWKITDAVGQKDYFLHVIINLDKPCDAFTVKMMSPIAFIIVLQD
jgi:hypothetical protein